MRRMPKILATIIAFMVCLSLIRAVLGAGHISLYDILLDIQHFDFSMEGVQELVEMVRGGSLTNNIFSWNHDLTGIDGFFTNIANAVKWFFAYIGNITKTMISASWKMLVELIRLLGNVINIALKLIGVIK